MLEKLINLVYGAIAMVWVILFIWWVDNLSNYCRIVSLQINQFALVIISVTILYVVAIFIHEAGHWFTGVRLGFIGTKFVVLWLNIERHGSNWKIKWAKRPAKVGGMVVLFPVNGHQLRRRKALIVAAGPLASLGAGGLAIAISYALANGNTFSLEPGRFLAVAELQLFGLVSTFLGCFNLLPNKIKNGMRNDGLLLWYLYRRDPKFDRELTLSALVGSSYAGLLPHQWDGDLLNRSLAFTDGTAGDCQAALFAYAHHLGAGRKAQARAYLEACLEKIDLLPASHQQEIYCEAAYFEACHGGNPAQAQHRLSQAQQLQPFERNEGHFHRAAVAWAEGQYEDARTYLQLAQAEPLGLDANDAGAHLDALDRLADLQNRLALADEPFRNQYIK